VNSSTIQEKEISWYNVQRPMSSIGAERVRRPQLSSSKRNQCETGSTIGSSHHQPNMHTTINSISEEDHKNFFYRPFTNIPIGLSNYKSKRAPTENQLHKRCYNSLSTIVKDETMNHEDVSTIHNFDIR